MRTHPTASRPGPAPGGFSAPAYADFTFIIGSNRTPSSRSVKGFAIGGGGMIATEFEYANNGEDLDKKKGRRPACGPSWVTCCCRRPSPLPDSSRMPTGTGVYRETLDAHQETAWAFHSGVGVKRRIFGPLMVSRRLPRAEAARRAVTQHRAPRLYGIPRGLLKLPTSAGFDSASHRAAPQLNWLLGRAALGVTLPPGRPERGSSSVAALSPTPCKGPDLRLWRRQEWRRRGLGQARSPRTGPRDRARTQ